MDNFESHNPLEGIAIIGITGRFPGAQNVEEFWHNLRAGVESISFFTDEELEASGSDFASLRNSPSYVKARGVLRDIELFDASFFGILPKEAEVMDPQHRIFLECAWEALESAGYDPESYTGSVGVYAGMGHHDTYFLSNLYCHPNFKNLELAPHVIIGNEKDYLTTRVSYKLNLKGPSISVHTTCSTSLVAVCQACSSLLSYQCDMALAGGISIRLPQKAGRLFQEGGISSNDGHTRTFDAEAKGTIFSNGAGIVVLKRLADAVADGDHIYAVIKGAALNNDGSSKVSFAAPGVDGQAEVIALAQALAGVDAESISYIEAHGTATPLGDPIEIAGLTQAFRASTDAKGFCAIGSVKTNIGHLDAAAGVAGLIKTTLALKHKLLPPSLNFQRPNPKIDFANSPFFVNTTLKEWETGETPRRAGVSSFGTGGTNAHVVLEEAPLIEPSEKSRPWQLLLLSAKTDSALDKTTANLVEHLGKSPEANLADVAYTLQVGRRAFNHRRMLVCRDLNDAAKSLETLDSKRVFTEVQEHRDSPVIFTFPGQGVQHVNMGLELYQVEPQFREQIDLCCEILQPLLNLDLRRVLYPNEAEATAAQQQLTETWITQPALFVIEYALSKLWMEWGVHPTAMIGHSVGEYVAACLAEVFSLEDALNLLAARGRLMQQLPGGSMLAVRLPEKEVYPLLGQSLSLAAINAASLCVVSGPTEAIESLHNQLTNEGVACRRLHTSHAFHSQMMEPILAPFTELVDKVKLNPPQIPYISNISATWITAADATDPAYWARHLRQAVRFAEGVCELVKDSRQVFLEVGPGQTLSTLVRQHPEKTAKQIVLSSLNHEPNKESDVASLLNTMGRLWMAGVPVDWQGFYVRERRQRVPLPTYPFERKRYWVEPFKHSNYETLQTNGDQAGVSDLVLAPRQEQQLLMEEMNEEVFMSALQAPSTIKSNRLDRIAVMLKTTLHELSGVSLDELDASVTFLEMGFDSLLLTQVSQALQNKFGVKITFRQLIEELPTVDDLAAYIDQKLPPEALPSDAPSHVPAPERTQQIYSLPSSSRTTVPWNALGQELPSAEAGEGAVPTTALERIIKQQLQVMTQQLEMLRNGHPVKGLMQSTGDAQYKQRVRPDQVAVDEPQLRRVVTNNVSSTTGEAQTGKIEAKPFGPFRPIQKGPGGGLTPRQQEHLEALIDRYTKRTPQSKRLTGAYRSKLADPRTASGFRSLWKEMVYPIIAERSAGSKIWDVDGNEYTDLVMGFGVNLFGHSPAFVTSAIEEQLKLGVEIGPQSPLAGKVAELVCELTGMERVAFCNTGSEAVMAALRVARTVTGRTKIALFANSYHGMFDEVLVRASTVNGELRSCPTAPGIPPSIVNNVLVLDYTNPQSLEILKAQAHELAAVLVEPVQGRNPDLQLNGFLHEVRLITEKSGTALIFDEVVTGFRVHPGGMQAVLGIKADLATYGKVIGGGLPIGVLAGKAVFMDALDGGVWNYGDASSPEAGVTFFAGTFVRHPLALAAAWAVLNHLKTSGPDLQKELDLKTSRFARALNDYFQQTQLPVRLVHFSSIARLRISDELKFAGLLFYHLREKGVHIWEDRSWLLSTAHTDEDTEYVIQAVKESVVEMRDVGFLPEAPPGPSKSGGLMPDLRIGLPNELPESLSGSNIKLAPVHSDVRGIVEVENLPLKTPLTEAQTEIWLATRLADDASRAFNLSHTIRLEGPLQVEAMRAATQQIVDRHEALRITFDPHGAFQQVSPSLTIEVPLVDLSNIPGDERSARVAGLLATEAGHLFDLVNGPLIRVRIVRLEANLHLVVLTAHHIICDGWSWGVLLRDLSALYSSACRRTSSDLPRPMQFREYALWQQQQSPDVAQAEAYWVEQFARPVTAPELPADYTRPPIKTYNSARQTIALDKSVGAELRRIGARQGCTLFSTLVAAFNTFLFRLTGQGDLVIGFPAAGQALVGRHDLVGHCVNMLPLRSQIDGAQGFNEYLRSIRKTVMDAYEHQNYTFGSLIKKLNLPRERCRLPLISVRFNLESALPGLNFNGLDVDLSLNPNSFGNPELFFNVIESDAELQLECSYNSDLFDQSTIRRWLRQFQTLLASIVTGPEQRIAELPLLTEAERHQLLVEWNDTAVEYPRDRCVHDLFEEQAERTPEALAVVFEDQQITYGECNAKTNQLARALRRRGVGPDVRVGLCVERSVEMLVGLLGILKAGGAYVPLNPEHPKARLAQQLADIQSPVLVTQEKLLDQLPDFAGEIVCLDRDQALLENEPRTNLERITAPQHLAYMIYTSGSTGVPKGVTISHRNLVNYTHFICQKLRLNESQDGGGLHFATVSMISADLGNTCIFPSLVSGGCLHVIGYGMAMDGRSFADYVAKRPIDVLKIVPSHLGALLASQRSADVLPRKYLILGGEALSWELIKRISETADGCEVINHYGPTETTVGSLTFDLREADARARMAATVPIGRPIANTEVYILDQHLKPVPVGVPGELYIGGVGLAGGYLNQPERTSERFVPNPFAGNGDARLYKTGDLARYLPDGNVEFIGRTDHQVKVRGFRVELGEIEAVLRQHGAVREAVVLAREDEPDYQRLVAYATLEHKNGSDAASVVGELRSFLKERLPEYMLPTAFVVLDALPLTANGKVDRRALPAPEQTRTDLDKAFVAPRTTLELQLAKMWEKLLGIRPLGVTDNFFELGGHSLLAVRLFDRIEKAFGKNLPLATLFQAPTIKQLAAILSQEGWQTSWTSLVELKAGGSRPPFFCAHGGFFFYSDLLRYVDADQPFYGVQPEGLGKKQARHARVEEIAAHYVKEMRQLQPEGPYYLGGFSFAGWIAFEMAQQLYAAGEKVGLLVLFDSFGPGYPKFIPMAQRVGCHIENLTRLGVKEKLRYVRGSARTARAKVESKVREFTYKTYLRVMDPLPRSLLMVVGDARVSALMSSYVPQIYPGRITLFRAAVQPVGCYYDAESGWGGLAAAGVDVREIPGGHGTLLQEPHVRGLAEELNPCLQEAQAAESSE